MIQSSVRPSDGLRGRPGYQDPNGTRTDVRGPVLWILGGVLPERYTPGVEIPGIVLLIMIGLAVLFGGSRPVKAVAVVFTVIGFWVSTTWVGEQVVAGLDRLARIIS